MLHEGKILNSFSLQNLDPSFLTYFLMLLSYDVISCKDLDLFSSVMQETNGFSKVRFIFSFKNRDSFKI